MSIDPTQLFSNAYGSAGATAYGAASPAVDSSSSGGVDTLDTSGSGSVYNLTTDDFMNMFLAQLQNQDPTQPMDNTQMLSQLSQMSMLQTFQGVEKALAGSQLAQSSALIGKHVTGMDVSNQPVDGVVTSVTQSTDAGLVLQVGTQYVKPDSVTVVTAAAAATTTPTPGSTT
jgi:flagellar basal-body rod modification protein FlgD